MASSGSPNTASTCNGAAPCVGDAQTWASEVRGWALRFERVAHTITSHRILYHLTLELIEPLPAAYLQLSNHICLGWPLGGIWKIQRCDGFEKGDLLSSIKCVAWKNTELTTDEVAALNKTYYVPELVATPPTGGAQPVRVYHAPPPTLFDWQMQLCERKGEGHWFLSDVGLPAAYDADTATISGDLPLSVKLFAGLTPAEVSLAVNSIHHIDTVAERYTADVTWQLTLPAITAIREETPLREFLDLLEVNEEEFEFSNLTEMQSEKPLVRKLSEKGERIQCVDPITIDQGRHNAPPTEMDGSPRLHCLTYSRRAIATFMEEMPLQAFPLDHQKLTFSFDMSKSMASLIPIAPVAGTPGRFASEHFKLGNVWRVVCGDKLFIGDVVDDHVTKRIRFEMLLERRSGYYLNVAVPAAIITYLCFASFAPLKDEDPNAKGATLMSTDARLQIVVTLLLTAVTFKNQVGSLLPQVSYFTTLDKYISVCFLIACIVAVENALFPLIARWWGQSNVWREYWLLWFFVWLFTIINVVWGVRLYKWVCKRDQCITVLMKADEYVRAIAHQTPHEPYVKALLLGRFLEEQGYEPDQLPQLLTTKRGDLFVMLPRNSDSLSKDHQETVKGKVDKEEEAIGDDDIRKQALHDLELANTNARTTQGDAYRIVVDHNAARSF